MERVAPFHEFSLPSMAKGAPPFINSQTKVDVFKKKVCFDLEMMSFLLQYDLGVMENVFHGFKEFLNSIK
jgi:hypothetical protein